MTDESELTGRRLIQISIGVFAVLALLIIGLVAGTSSRESNIPATPRNEDDHVPNTARPGSPSFQRLIANIWVGQPLYLKSDESYVGEVYEISDEHLFENGKAGEAVRVLFVDCTAMWMPRETAQLLYVTKARAEWPAPLTAIKCRT